jgi:PKHD-type hydroxylase
MFHTLPTFDSPYYIGNLNLPPDVLRSLVQQCKSLEDDLNTALIGDETLDKKLMVNSKVRDCQVRWLSQDMWISGVMASLMSEANSTFYEYDLTSWSDPIQYTVYTGKGSQYSWHYDTVKDPTGNKLCRKLSISVFLSDPSEYEGGEFQIHNLRETTTLKPEAGTFVIFPSSMPHRVRPLKSGVRRSLVGWRQGPFWR